MVSTDVDEGVRALAAAQALAIVDLRYCSLVTDDGVRTLESAGVLVIGFTHAAVFT